jgi:hypothetical protein
MARSVIYEFDPFEVTGLKKPKGANKREILRDVGDFLVETVLKDVSNTNSPVKGHGKFKRLSKDYKAFKKSQGAGTKPNLELEGDMLEALKYTTKGDKIQIGIKGKQGDKADGHNNHSGESELPLRRFIPAEGETFKRGIIKGVKDIIKAYED